MEKWKTVNKPFNEYEISNAGRVRSTKTLKSGLKKVRILKSSPNKNGYGGICLSYNGWEETVNVHQLVAIYFKGHKPKEDGLLIRHKDGNRINNNVDNLELITFRQRSSIKSKGHSSQYTGVSWNKTAYKWYANITTKGKTKYLGTFHEEIEAHNAYQIALKAI